MEGRERWDGAGLHTRRTSLALDMSRTVSGLYLKLVLHPVDGKNGGQSEKTVLPSFLGSFSSVIVVGNYIKI